MNIARAIRPLLLASGVLLTGCAAGPPPSLYVLDFPIEKELAGIERGITVGVGPIELPQYLDRPQIVSRASPNRLETSELHQWAEPLKTGVARVLVVAIGRRLDTNRVYIVPRRIRTALDYRVEIDIGRFDGAIGQGATLAARWSLFRGDGASPSLTQVSVIEEPVRGDGYPELVAAHTRAAERLGTDIATAIERQ